ncbi:MAG TPA: LptF/LptG family permease [Thermodesulforhabdus norvegica]|uniref:LptF/LptG family permease n=1 Tax=Thermodesulforhabdus norvegica TaxID=39841 RepID=A0A7C1AWV6_9BACT|nr:LptF/LptG family permease [Thermodesulforhabdus norvegica]
MKILHRFVITSFLRIWIVALFASLSLFLSADFFEKIDDLIEMKVSVGTGIHYFAFRIPYMISQIFAPSLLIAAMLLYIQLHRHRESTAMKAAGISPVTYTIPTIVVGFILTVCFFFFREYVERPLFQSAENLWLSKKASLRHGSARLKDGGLWYATNKMVMHMKYYDPQKRVFHGVSIFFLDENFGLKHQIEADIMQWAGGKWYLYNVRKLELSGGRIRVYSEDMENLSINERPEDFTAIRSLPETITINQLVHLIRLMKQEKVNPRPYVLELFMRMAECLMALIALATATICANNRFFASNVIKIALGGTFLYAVTFGMLQVGFTLATAGYISPVTGTTFPLIFSATFLAWLYRSMD